MPFAASGKDREGKSGIFRKTKAWDKKENKFSNVFKNAILPLSGGKLIKGSAVYVALEVAVSKLLRRISGVQDRSILQLAVVHTMSLALMGGTSAALTDHGTIYPYGGKEMKQHIKQGMKGVPALFLANYIYNTFFYGFFVGSFSMKNLMIMAAAKILTRPIAAKIYPMSKFTQNALDTQQLMEEFQASMSNLAKIAEKDRYIKPSNQ